MRDRQDTKSKKRYGNIDCQLLDIQPTADLRTYHKLLKQRFDIFDVGQPGKDGRPCQETNERFQRHLNAGANWRDLLPALPQWKLALHRIGRRTIYLKPRRDRCRPQISNRIDGDEHEAGQTGAKQFIETLNERFFGGKLYDEPSTRGHGAWVTFDLPEVGVKDGVTLYLSKHDANGLMDEFQQALEIIRQAMQITASFEVNGRIATPGRMDDGTLVVRDGHRGSMVKLPKCRTPESVDRFANSTFSIDPVYQIIEASKDLSWLIQAVEPAPTPAVEPIPEVTPKRQDLLTKRKSDELQDKGDKHSNRVQCASAAQQELGRDCDRDTLKQRANDIYCEHGFNGGERDHDRDQAFDGIFNWFERTFDEDAAGNDKYWFIQDDIDRADCIIRSKLARHKLKQINKANKKRLRGFRITYNVLAWGMVTFAKNVVTNNGEVPTSSISGMLRFYGMNASNMGSVVDIITDTLIEITLLECTSTSYKVGKWSRKYALRGAAQRLSFIAEYYLQLERDEHLDPTIITESHGFDDCDVVAAGPYQTDEITHSLFTTSIQRMDTLPHITSDIIYQPNQQLVDMLKAIAAENLPL